MSASVTLAHPDNRPMDTAPRNGLSILVGDEDVGAFIMHWDATGTNPFAQDGMGIWVALDGSMTWSEADGMGPKYWRPLPEGEVVL